MDFQHIVFTFLFIILVLKCCDAGTVTTESFLKARMGFHPVNFKCNYTLESHETVHAGDISWQIERIKGSGNFETIAEYSPPDAPIKLNQFAKTPTGSEFKTRSVLPDIVDAGSNTYTAVFRLYEVRCEDEGNFRCLVVFSSSTGTHNVTSESSLLVTAPAEKPYRAPQPEPDNIEEGMTVKFSCTANVGKPPGNIKWWRFKQGQSVPNFMGESNTTPLMQTDVCVYNLTSSISALTMSRDDDRSVWRCSVNNNLLTAYPDYEKPHEDSKRIRVYYSVSTPSIEITPNYAKYQVGSNITIYCSADGNPSPLIDNHINYYIWTFKTRGKANDVILTSNNGLLALQNIREENSGRYTCTAHNGFNGKNFNSSNHVEINVHSGPSVHHTTEAATSSSTSSSPETTVEKTTATTEAGSAGTTETIMTGVSSTESTSTSPVGTSEIPTPSPFGDCNDNPNIDCRMYNLNVTCALGGMYYPWARKNCPLYCGYCQVPTVSVECKDKLPTCDEYQSDLCTNHLFRLFREKNCRKFCKICEGVDYVASPSVVG